MCAFVHGRFGDAFAFHAFGPLLYVTVLSAWVFMAVSMAKGQDPIGVRFEHISKFMIGVVVAMVVYWVVRLLLGAVP